jgi:multidrug efflux pump subunit AcrB
MNSSPDLIDTINDFPVKEAGGRIVFMRDVAHVHDGYQIQTNSVSENGRPGALMMVRKTGGSSTLAVVNGIKASPAGNPPPASPGRGHQADFRPIHFRQGRPE